jgi:(E)-4-hydroxy-3-methylbut-2-enyl-diphosphate synthase
VRFGDPNIGSLTVGAAEPVRVELDLGSCGDDPEAAASRLARSLASLRDVECEGLSLAAADDAALSRAFAFIDALERAGVRLAISLRSHPEIVAAGIAGETAREAACARVARWIAIVASATDDAALREVARVADEAHASLEWCLAGLPAQVAESLDRVLALRAPSPSQRPDPTRPVDAFSVLGPRPAHAIRAVAARLRERGGPRPALVLRESEAQPGSLAIAQHDMLATAVDLGGPLCDGLGDVVAVRAFADPAVAVDCAYRVLQGARLRTTRTEFISCPSCGRTLFDLEQITARIKDRTAHLKGLKIAIMGCIVNGPGEMADADFGYVGSGVGQVTLYVGKEVVARAVPESTATDRLVDLIRSHGAWTDPD